MNGWDNATDNNTGKSFGISIGYVPAEVFSGYVNYHAGTRAGQQQPRQRSLVDLVATIKPAKPLSIILNYDNGKEENAVPQAPQNGPGSPAS